MNSRRLLMFLVPLLLNAACSTAEPLDLILDLTVASDLLTNTKVASIDQYPPLCGCVEDFDNGLGWNNQLRWPDPDECRYFCDLISCTQVKEELERFYFERDGQIIAEGEISDKKDASMFELPEHCDNCEDRIVVAAGGRSARIEPPRGPYPVLAITEISHTRESATVHWTSEADGDFTAGVFGGLSGWWG